MTQITVSGREGVCTRQEPLTSGSAGMGIAFAFDRAWDALTRIAVFRGSGRSVDVVLPESNATVIPPEVLCRDGGSLRVGVYGTDGSGALVIPTVWIPVGPILAGAFPSGFSPGALTPSLAEHVITDADRAARQAAAAARRAESARDEAEAAAALAGQWGEAAAASAEDAAASAELARQNAANRGWIWFTIDGDGNAVFHRTENVEDLRFRLDEEGNMVVRYGE